VESQLSELEDEEAIQRMIANGTIFEELSKFKQRLAELNALNERLRNNGAAPPPCPRTRCLSTSRGLRLPARPSPWVGALVDNQPARTRSPTPRPR